MMRPALLAQSKRGRIILAAAAVLGVVIFSSIAAAPQASASTIEMGKTKGFVTFTGNQPNIARCVDGIKSAAATNQGGTKDKRVNQVKVRFDEDNVCEGATLSVAAVDENGKVSEGSLLNLPVGAKDNVLVTMTGTAIRSDNPNFYLLVS